MSNSGSSDNTNSDKSIVSAAIYPPIGIMRVGNSPAEYFIGPEVDEPIPHDSAFYRDGSGALKRQAARFRVYGLNAKGEAVAELTADNAKITWTTRLANQKSSWYKFQLALDIPEAASAPPSTLRNIDVTGSERMSLLIDGGEHSVEGCSVNGDDAPKFHGEFKLADSDKVAVYLGEMHTDDKGRLLMLGGHGKSANPEGKPATSYGNNEGWYDDTSDGPVTAQVEYNGVSLEVKPAWVVCTPPDYAPMQKSVRTMWDLMRDIFVSAGMLERPAKPSFTRDILPLFQRNTDLQWVNAGFAAGFGWESNNDFTLEDWIERANSTDLKWREWRRVLANNFRRLDVAFFPEKPAPSRQTWDPTYSALAPQLWPWIYGDAMDINANDSPRQFVSITSLQTRFLQQWVNGDFIADYVKADGPKPDSTYPKIHSIDQLPVSEQPDMLTKAAMDFCLADAFHPGCEMTWPMRTVGMYSEAYRLKPSDNTAPTHGINYGPVMTTEIIQQPDGPLLSGQVAGGITRWMAVPWQTDTASCRDGYNRAYDPYLPTFWPARVPNNVLSQANYEIVTDSTKSLDERQTAFNKRRLWLDDLPIGPSTDYYAQINSMVDGFDHLTVVVPKDDEKVTDFPTTMQVGETPFKPKPAPEAVMAKSAILKDAQPPEEEELRPDLSNIDKANRWVK